MKRVLRSTFDPLPRSLPTPGLIALVALVVLGTAVTVHRYLESASPTDRRSLATPARAALSRPSEVRAAPSESGSNPTHCPFFEACRETRTDGGATAADSGTSMSPASVAPSAFRPDDSAVGG